MGFWDSIYSTTDALNRNAPDLTPVKDACFSFYNYSWSGVTKIDNAVRVNGIQRLKQHLPDDEGRARIGRFLSKLAKNATDYACRESFKCVPGGHAFYNIVSRTVHDEMAFQAKMDALKESSGFGKTFEQTEIRNCNVELGPRNALLDSNANQKPEDLIKILVMNEYVGKQILSDLIIQHIRRGKNWK